MKEKYNRALEKRNAIDEIEEFLDYVDEQKYERELFHEVYGCMEDMEERELKNRTYIDMSTYI